MKKETETEDWTVKLCDKCHRTYKITEIHVCPDNEIMDFFRNITNGKNNEENKL
jgi:hypothetical protein